PLLNALTFTPLRIAPLRWPTPATSPVTRNVMRSSPRLPRPFLAYWEDVARPRLTPTLGNDEWKHDVDSPLAACHDSRPHPGRARRHPRWWMCAVRVLHPVGTERGRAHLEE